MVTHERAEVVSHNVRPLYAASLPGLAAALRNSHVDRSIPVAHVLSSELVQAYRVAEGDLETETGSAAHVIRHMADRLRRLTTAYGEWTVFDAPAYFDLSAEVAGQLVFISERMTTVHVTIYADLLLPSFQRVCQEYTQRFAPSYAQMYNSVEQAERFFQQVQPRLIAQWRATLAATLATRNLLLADIGFLAVNGAEEERWRWRWAWRQPVAPGIDADLLTALTTIPTLTLSIDFPLPLSRQPGRQRRLRLHRERQRRRR